MIECSTAILWVKHGTTEEVYSVGTSGVFTTNDNKQISNVVFLIEIIVDENEEEEVDKEELDDEVLGDDEENEEEESLPDTSDATAGLGLITGLFGLILLFATKKKTAIVE